MRHQLLPPTNANVEKIAANLSDTNRHELEALGVSVSELCETVAFSGDVNVMGLDGEPVYCWGTFGGRVRNLFGFGTPKFLRVARAVEKHGRTSWLPKIMSEGVSRIEARIPVSSPTQVWLARLGMRVDCVLHHFSATGEPFFLLSYTKDDFQNVFFPEGELPDAASYARAA